MNKLSKPASIALIKRAVQMGWTRKVDKCQAGPAWRYVQVALSASYHKGLLYAHGHILISYTRRDGRWKIAVETNLDYEKRYRPGKFHAEYAVNNYMARYLAPAA